MENVTSTQQIPASREDYPRLDLAYLGRSLRLTAHHPVTASDRRQLVRCAESVIESIESRMALTVIAARCESLIVVAARLVKKVEAKQREEGLL
ncbi:MAG: hypothetical protein ACE5JU_21325 [Candidatus Binatia bacterium]